MLDERVQEGPASSRRPLGTWIFMFLAVVATVVQPEEMRPEGPWPVWLIGLPVVLGIVGAVLAIRGRHFWWGVISAAWGFILIQALVIVVTLISGP